jgi:hypothetical protein
MWMDETRTVNTPVYETIVHVSIRYPGPSPEEAYALHKQFVSRIRNAAEGVELLGLLGVAEPVTAELTDFEGPCSGGRSGARRLKIAWPPEPAWRTTPGANLPSRGREPGRVVDPSGCLPPRGCQENYRGGALFLLIQRSDRASAHWKVEFIAATSGSIRVRSTGAELILWVSS